MNNNIQELKQSLRSDWKMFQELLGGSKDINSEFKDADGVQKRISMMNLLLNGQVFPGDTRNICTKLHMNYDCLDTIKRCFKDGDDNCKKVFSSSAFLSRIQQQLGDVASMPTVGEGGNDKLVENLEFILKSIGFDMDNINDRNEVEEGRFVLAHSITNVYDNYVNTIVEKFYDSDGKETEASREIKLQLEDKNRSDALKHLIRVYRELTGILHDDDLQHKFDRINIHNRPKIGNLLQNYSNNESVTKYMAASNGFFNLVKPFFVMMNGGLVMTGGSVYSGIQFGGTGQQAGSLKILQSIINRRGVLAVDYLDALIDSSDEILKSKGLSINTTDKTALKEQLKRLAPFEEEIYKIAFYLHSVFKLQNKTGGKQTGGADITELLVNLSDRLLNKKKSYGEQINIIAENVEQLMTKVNKILSNTNKLLNEGEDEEEDR